MEKQQHESGKGEEEERKGRTDKTGNRAEGRETEVVESYIAGLWFNRCNSATK